MYTHMQTHVRMHAHTRTHIHTHACTYAHTHTHTVVVVVVVYGMLPYQQVNMFIMLYTFGYFMRQDLVYTSFGFHDGHPTMIGLFLVFQFIFSPYYQV